MCLGYIGRCCLCSNFTITSTFQHFHPLYHSVSLDFRKYLHAPSFPRYLLQSLIRHHESRKRLLQDPVASQALGTHRSLVARYDRDCNRRCPHDYHDEPEESCCCQRDGEWRTTEHVGTDCAEHGQSAPTLLCYMGRCFCGILEVANITHSR